MIRHTKRPKLSLESVKHQLKELVDTIAVVRERPLRRICIGMDLRHEYACRLAERGVPIAKIQYLSGHASIVTTERYIHHTLAELAKAAAGLEDGGVTARLARM